MNRPVRLLLPWLEAHEAVSALLGFRLPQQGEDLRPVLARYEQQRRALAERPPYALPTAAVEPLPATQQARGEEFLRATRFEGMPVRVGIVDLSTVLAYQKVVSLDAIEERTSGVEDDADRLFELCLPPPRPAEEIDGTFDRDGKGLTISSPNPNLRVSQLQQVARRNGGGNDQLIGYSITFGSSHVHIAEYQGRFYLKDGYHRCYGLLARGVHRIPCVVGTARSFSEVVGAGGGHIGQEHLAGARPPMLADFLDDRVSVRLEQRYLRKVVRIRAEEFVAHG